MPSAPRPSFCNPPSTKPSPPDLPSPPIRGQKPKKVRSPSPHSGSCRRPRPVDNKVNKSPTSPSLLASSASPNLFREGFRYPAEVQRLLPALEDVKIIPVDWADLTAKDWEEAKAHFRKAFGVD